MTTMQDPHPDDPHPDDLEGLDMSLVADMLSSLEPDGVDAYVVAVGHAFDGIQLYGPLNSFNEAIAWQIANPEASSGQIVPVWGNYPTT